MKYLIILSIVIFGLGIFWFLRIKEKGIDTFYIIDSVFNPRQVLWFNDLLYIVQEDKYYQYEIATRILIEEGVINEDQILGIVDKKIELITYYNNIVNSEEDYATIITIKGVEYKYHETIKPIIVKENTIIAIDNYPNSPERKYSIDLEENKVSRYHEEYTLSGKDKISISKDEKKIFQIDKSNDIKEFYINEKEEKVAFLDNDGYLWLYIPADMLSNIL